MKLIAETAWHHEGDFPFMTNLVTEICDKSEAAIVKMHITLDFDEYMSRDHDSYELLKSWLFTAEQWEKLIHIVRKSGKELMLLLNDTSAIDFASQFSPELVELHSVCLNVPKLNNAILEKISQNSKVVIGVGGCTLQEVDVAVETFRDRSTILMFGFQNYPTIYENINLNKIRKIQSLYADKEFGYADHTAWNESNHELITLLVAANGMDYIEKHVTIDYGRERCDYSAAISIEMMNNLADRIRILEKLQGDGFIGLNQGEKDYSQYGPMKMAAIANENISKNSDFKPENLSFCRTGQKTMMSQIAILKMKGKPVSKDVNKGQVIDWKHFEG